SQYVWVTSSSFAALRYADTFVRETLSRAGEPGMAGYVIEAASNDGAFLKAFAQAGRPVLGVDPAENISRLAMAQGIPTIRGFFGADLARRIVAEHGYPGVVAARNVLPHVA